ncbi:8-oxo-dGTP pyrophosphatase MutT, NUDIX family [Litoreibacter ascidiaceicola]|uniref:8-oxo-dGTP pyrophosphatase MutT, NUDIX family n=1 Tax=Litoreibacter ascidiaceicola TaxID=1486859 RepID=A0A1M4Y4N2_9RHOB|nr:NUDIX hydrolase [Litoreibacter ascidiaceicola]SHF00576.1 8-oxo-dGTP pyrophosphatase MutT, NUDIX family [Litoreibacter ascidiaceicola]
MSLIKMKHPALRMEGSQKRDVRTQFGALCFRVQGDETQVLLVTSRNSRRWIIPKGWPMEDQSPAQAAAIEAFEEAGVEGKAYNICLGLYSYTKVMDKSDNLPCAVSVFPLKVQKIHKVWPESKQRTRKWFSVKKAAARVREPELRKIIKNFNASLLKA